MGNGIYGTDHQETRDYYARFLNEPAFLELSVNVRRSLTVDLTGIRAFDRAYDLVLRLLPDGPNRYWQTLRTMHGQNTVVLDEANRRFPVASPALPAALRSQLLRNREAFFDNRGFVRDPNSEALVVVLQQDGYDAMEIFDVPFRANVGGNQIVVFDPRRVVVIDE